MKDYFRRINRNKNIKPEILADLDRFLSEEFVTEDHDLYEGAKLYEEAGLSEEAHLYKDAELSKAAEPREDAVLSMETQVSEDFYASIDASFDESLAAPKASAPNEYAGYTVSGSIEDVFGSLGETFQQKLLKTIDAKGLTDAQVYTKANLDRRLFSKIRCNVNYKPSKSTALALAIALGLDLDETTDLLGRAGLALSPSSKADLIVKYCIINRIYDILDVNALLYEYDQQLLGY